MLDAAGLLVAAACCLTKASFRAVEATLLPPSHPRLTFPSTCRLARLEAAHAALTQRPGGPAAVRDEVAEVVEELSHGAVLLATVKKDLDSIFARLRRTRAALAAAFPQHAVAPVRHAEAEEHLAGARQRQSGGQQQAGEQQAEEPQAVERKAEEHRQRQPAGGERADTIPAAPSNDDPSAA